MTLATRLRRPATIRSILVTAGVFGWLALAALGFRMYGTGPQPGAGFDLWLLTEGGRHVAAGISPYDPTMLAGGSVRIANLFYSYPPLVAQAFSLLAFAPAFAIFAGAGVLATVAAVGVGRLVATVAGASAIGPVAALPVAALPVAPMPIAPMPIAALPIAALLPFWFPYTVAVLFGNVDMFFPALYGLVLIAVLRPASPRADRWVVLGGVALALASVIKLHPAVLGLWLLARGVRELRLAEDVRTIGRLRLPRSWRIAAVAVIAVAAIFGISLAVGGLQPWREYVAVLRAGASVDLLDPRNIGPAVQIVMLFALGPGAVGPIQVVVLSVALAVTIVSAIRVADPLESLAWAAAASFVVLPVTWFHHFAALIPFGIAAIARGAALTADVVRRLWILLVVSYAIVMIGFAQPPTWLLVPVVLAAARLSRRPDRDDGFRQGRSGSPASA